MDIFIIALLAFSILAYLPRLILPWIVRRWSKRMGGFTNTQQNNGNAGTTIKKAPHQDKKVDKNVGEYVDYEEIYES